MSQLKTTVSKPSIALFGEVLIDQFPDGQKILGGAPFNVAWHLQAFWQSPRFISKVGSDQIGADIKVVMEAWGMSLTGLQVDTLYPTGKVAIQINSGEPSYDILDQQAYDFIDANQLDLSEAYDVIYHVPMICSDFPVTSLVSMMSLLFSFGVTMIILRC